MVLRDLPIRHSVRILDYTPRLRQEIGRPFERCFLSLHDPSCCVVPVGHNRLERVQIALDDIDLRRLPPTIAVGMKFCPDGRLPDLLFDFSAGAKPDLVPSSG